LILGGANTLTGNVLASAGTLTLEHATAVSTAASVQVTNARLDLFGYSIVPPVSLLSSDAAGASASLLNSSSNVTSTVTNLIIGGSAAATSTYTLNSSGGEIVVAAATLSTAPGTIRKLGIKDVTLSSSIGLTAGTALSVDAGRLRIKGNASGAATIASGATLSFEHTSLSTKKTFSGAVSGAGELEIRGGWVELTGAVTHTGMTKIIEEGAYNGEAMLQSTLSVSDSFQPTGAIQLDGILLVTLNSADRTWGNVITGEGLLKKYGPNTLTLTGNLSGFTGAMQVQEGLLISNGTWTKALEVYAGATLLSDVHTGASQTSTIAGNIFGASIRNDGSIYLGNDSTDTQLISASDISGSGSWYMNGNNKVRVTATSGNNTIQTAYSYNGILGFNGVFSPTDSSGVIYASGRNGVISFDPGSSYSGRVYASRGTILVQGFNIDRSVSLTNVSLYFGGTLDVSSDKINNDVIGESILKVTDFIGLLQPIVNLRPDVNANSSDAPLLEILNTMQLDSRIYPYHFYHRYYGSQESRINIIPQGIAPSELITYNLLKLSHADLRANTALKDQIISLLKPSALYALESASFDENGLLTCTLRAKDFQEVFNAPELQEMSRRYRSLGLGILAQQSSANDFTKSLYRTIVNSQDPSQMNNRLEGYSPLGTKPSTTSNMVQSHGARTAQGMMVSVRTLGTLNRLMSAQGLNGKESNELMKKAVLSQWKGSDLIGSKVAHGSDPNAQSRLKDYRNIDLNGLSFSSESSYAHQTMTKQSEEDPGTTQSSWASSVGATYTKNKQVVFGAIASTTKTNETLNPNQMSKTALRGDRYNNAGLTGLYQTETQPWYVSGLMTYGQHNYNVCRTWLQPVEGSSDLACQATSAYKAYETYVTAEAGWKYQLNETMMLQPYAGATLSRVTNSAYQETSTTVSTGAANNYGIIVPSQTNTTQIATVGIEFIQAVKVSDVQSQIMARAGWTTQKLAGDSTDYSYAFLGDPTVTYTEETDNQRYNTFDINFGVHSAIGKRLYVSAMYTGNYGKYATTQTAMVSMDYYIGS